VIAFQASEQGKHEDWTGPLRPMNMLPFIGRIDHNLYVQKLDLKWMKSIIWMKFDDLDNTFITTNGCASIYG
jgi:hypothetical protein